jgi:hypothetical protein
VPNTNFGGELYREGAHNRDLPLKEWIAR